MDFGDLIFFIVFAVIIISNILKQLKKADSKTAEGKTPAKKAGWKNILETMLEQAKKQMENAAAPESAGAPLKHKSQGSGWDDIISDEDLISRQPAEFPGKAGPVKTPGQPVSPQKPALEKAVFRPECLRCGDLMRRIKDSGAGVQNGLVYCDGCGEQHKFKIINGEMELKQKRVPQKPERSVATQFQQLETKKEKSKKRFVEEQQDCYADTGFAGPPSQISQQGLRNAVIWSEILASPLGLRDLER